MLHLMSTIIYAREQLRQRWRCQSRQKRSSPSLSVSTHNLLHQVCGRLTIFIFKEAKSLSKIIKSESKAEEAALNVSIKELAALYKQQSYTVKPKHTKALVLHHKTDCLRMSTPMLVISLRGQLKRLG